MSETLHYMSHVYHNISDLMIDMNRPPPRQLHAAPVPPPQAAAIIQQTIPVQVCYIYLTCLCIIIFKKLFFFIVIFLVLTSIITSRLEINVIWTIT